VPEDAGLKTLSPGVAWTLQVGFGNEKRPKQLNVGLHVPLDMAGRDVDVLLDKVRTSLERQVAVYDLEEAIEIYEGHLSKMREMHLAVDTVDELARADWEGRGRHGDYKLTPAQEKNKIAAQGNMKQWEEKTLEWRDRVDKLRKKVAENGSNERADRIVGSAES
jgi:hypothetical protein